MDKQVKFYLFTQRRQGVQNTHEAEDMGYSIPSDYQRLILSVGYYSTVRKFGGTMNRKESLDVYNPLTPPTLKMTKIKPDNMRWLLS